MTNENKAKEIANAFFIENVSVENEQVIREMLNKAAFEAMQWKDEQLADYLQREWDRCAGACSSIVSAYCRDVERMANDLGIKLKFNNPYIE